MNRASVVRGVIIPYKWDEQDNVTTVAISAVGELEYPIEMNGMGKNLMRHIHHEVRLEGRIYKNIESDCDVIDVGLFEILN